MGEEMVPVLVSCGLCKCGAVHAEATARPTLLLVPLVQPSIEGRRH